MLYQAYQIQTDAMSPLHRLAEQLGRSAWLQQTERSLLRQLAAACETLSSRSGNICNSLILNCFNAFPDKISPSFRPD